MGSASDWQDTQTVRQGWRSFPTFAPNKTLGKKTLNIPQHQDSLPKQNIISPQMSIVLRMGNPGLGHVVVTTPIFRWLQMTGSISH